MPPTNPPRRDPITFRLNAAGVSPEVRLPAEARWYAWSATDSATLRFRFAGTNAAIQVEPLAVAGAATVKPAPGPDTFLSFQAGAAPVSIVLWWC